MDIERANGHEKSFRRSLYLNKKLSAGSIIKEEDIAILRPAVGIPASFYYDLVGKKLLVGNAKVEGIDLCRPCRHLTEVLDQDNILKEFLRRGGLRCQILSSSNIYVGDNIKILD